MGQYIYNCVNSGCEVELFSVFEPISMNEQYETRPCPVCCETGTRYYGPETMPGIKFKGLGFSVTDAEYEKQLIKAEMIASNMYNKRAEQSVAKDKISEDTTFWDHLENRDYDVKRYREKKAQEGIIVKPQSIPKNEEKTSINVGKTGFIDGSSVVRVRE